MEDIGSGRKAQSDVKWQSFDKDWERFKQTKEYNRISNNMKEFGIKDPYCDNIIFRIFYSGYFNEPFIKD